MEETKTLQMVFRNKGNGRVTISVLDPRDDLTQAQVEEAMNNIVAANIIDSKGGILEGIISARIINRQVTDLFA